MSYGEGSALEMSYGEIPQRMLPFVSFEWMGAEHNGCKKGCRGRVTRKILK